MPIGSRNYRTALKLYSRSAVNLNLLKARSLLMAVIKQTQSLNTLAEYIYCNMPVSEHKIAVF